MKDDAPHPVFLMIVGGLLGCGVSVLLASLPTGIKTYYEEAVRLKEECETTIPRNEVCVMKFVPEKAQSCNTQDGKLPTVSTVH